MRRRARHLGAVFFIGCLSMVAVAFGATACGSGAPEAYGSPVDPSSAVSLARLLSGDDVAATETITVSGRIGEVCRSAGCWFVLEDRDPGDGRYRQLYVDLKRGASFTVPASIEGRRAIVLGRLAGEPPDLRLDALGLVLVQ